MYNYLKQKSDSQHNIERFKNTEKRANRKGKRPPKYRFKAEYTSLKVIPKSKRTETNSNSCGVTIGKE